MTSECHERVTNVYENLVDKDFELEKQDLMALISEIHFIFDKINDIARAGEKQELR